MAYTREREREKINIKARKQSQDIKYIHVHPKKKRKKAIGPTRKMFYKAKCVCIPVRSHKIVDQIEYATAIITFKLKIK